MSLIQNSGALLSSIDMNLVEYDETQNPFADAFCAPMIRWDIISSAYNSSSGKTRVWDKFAGTAFEMKTHIKAYLWASLQVFSDNEIPNHCHQIEVMHGLDSSSLDIGKFGEWQKDLMTILAILLEHHENGLI